MLALTKDALNINADEAATLLKLIIVIEWFFYYGFIYVDGGPIQIVVNGQVKVVQNNTQKMHRKIRGKRMGLSTNTKVHSVEQ